MKTVRLLVMTAGLVAGGVFLGGPAQAAEPECCKYPDVAVKAAQVQALKHDRFADELTSWTREPPPPGWPSDGSLPASILSDDTGSAFGGDVADFVKGPWFPEPVELYSRR